MNNPVFRILQRVLVRHFYKTNTAFFLFWFFVLFGIVAPGQVVSYHLSLIHGMLQSSVFMAFVLFVWCLYALKCVVHITQHLKEPRQQFLFVLHHLPKGTQWRYLFIVQVQIMAPILIYAGIVSLVAAREHHTGPLIIVILAIFLLSAAPVFIYRRHLQRTNTRFRFLMAGRHIAISKTLSSLPAWYIWKNKKEMLLATKLFTFFILYLFIAVNERENTDIRPLLLILLLASLAHVPIIFQIRSFEEEYLVFTRNLPVSIIKRFLGLVLVCFALLLPEFLFMWKGYPVQFRLADYLHLVLFMLSLLCFFYSILLMSDTDMEHYIRRVFLLCGGLFFLILYSPGILLPLGLITLSFVFFSAHFNTFEKRLT